MHPRATGRNERRALGVRFAPTAIALSCLATVSLIATVGTVGTVATVARAEGTAGSAAGVAHESVRGAEVLEVEVATAAAPLAGERVAWRDLSAPRAPGRYRLRWTIGGDGDAGGPAAVEVPVCAGRGAITLQGAAVALPRSGGGPVVVPLHASAAQVLTVDVNVGAYERRIACGAPLRVGAVASVSDGLFEMTFASPHAAQGGGRAVVYLPPQHDGAKPAALLVGAHPWNGGPWTYAAYAELLEEAAARDVVLLMPSGLGNSLYTAAAEDEVLRAIDALAAKIALDPRRTSIWGASMGGAGATTIGFHHPDRFASVTSLFGDSAYDLTTYVHAVLPDDAAAHRVNALDVAENARHLPVWLIHGEADRVSPIVQSAQLARALSDQGFTVRFDRIPGAGHEGSLVARFARAIVARADEARAVTFPPRVTYRSVRPEDTGAYGVRLVRAGHGDAFVDIEARDGVVHLRRAEGLRAVVLAPGALGTRSDGPPPRTVVDEAARARAPEVRVEWATGSAPPR